MVTMKVSASDLARYEGLASVNDVDVGTCIKAYIYEEELFINSIMVLDECCCELWLIHKKNYKRLVTLSPLPPMATHFHISNGAKQIHINDETQNFEYKLQEK